MSVYLSPRFLLASLLLGSASLSASEQAFARSDEWSRETAVASHPGTPPVARAPQLAVENFSECLRKESPVLDWAWLFQTHSLSKQDGFLTYLSVYPNRRIPILDELKQGPAHERWQVHFEAAEERLVSALFQASDRPMTPGPVFGLALQACRDFMGGAQDPLCAALILHNAFRTMGRNRQAILDPLPGFPGHTRDLNPYWYRANPEFWNSVFPMIQDSLLSLRTDGKGDRFGEWYHFFGILAFTVHEAALRGAGDGPTPDDLWLAELATRANRVLNPVLAGGQEDPAKARVDLDTVEVAKAWFFAPSRPISEDTCRTREGYVAHGRQLL